MIYTIRTTSGREDIVVDLLISKVEADGIDIKSVFHPAEIKGYVFIEGALGAVHKAMVGLMHSRGLIDKPIKLGEIQHFLEYKKARIRVDEGDIVEIIGGPFKGEKGRVNRINKIKDEITAELLEASIPIPVTIATEFVKVIKKAHPEKVEKPAEEEKEEEGKSVFDKEELEKVGEEKPEKEQPKEEEPPKEEPAPEPEKAEEAENPEAKEAPKEEKKNMLQEIMDEEKAVVEEPKEESPLQEAASTEEAKESFVEELQEEGTEKKKKKKEEYE